MMAGLFVLFSCKGKLGQAERIDLDAVPLQSVRNMFVVDTENGRLKLRMEGGLMQRFETDTSTYELFPEGFSVFVYDEDGELETTINSQRARHTMPKNGNETWMVNGKVRVENIEKREVMESDTLYWDRTREVIWTDCYVKIYSPDGFMQGYGMESDQRARNTLLRSPFNSYAFVEGEEEQVDSVNLIGPVQHKLSKFPKIL